MNAQTTLTTSQAAGYLGVSRQWLAKLRCCSSTGPVYCKLGKRVVYRIEDLDAWLAANRRRSTSQTPQAA